MQEKDLKSLHLKILELVEYFDEFCEKNKITYYLMGGSALGAIRHGGFIPWDDDFDIFMDRVNYLKFTSLIKNKIDSEKYYFQEENSRELPLYFSKLRMNNTTFIEKDVSSRIMHHGIYIDIMCLHGASSNMAVRYIQYLAARILNTNKEIIFLGSDINNTLLLKLYIFLLIVVLFALTIVLLLFRESW